MNTPIIDQTTETLLTQASQYVDRLRLDHERDERLLPAYGLTDKQVGALCGAAVATALLALAGEVRALRLALCHRHPPGRP